MKLTFLQHHSCTTYTTSKWTRTVRLDTHASLIAHPQDSLTYRPPIVHNMQTMTHEASQKLRESCIRLMNQYRIYDNSTKQNTRFPRCNLSKLAYSPSFYPLHQTKETRPKNLSQWWRRSGACDVDWTAFDVSLSPAVHTPYHRWYWD